MPITPPSPGALVESSWGAVISAALNDAHVQAGSYTPAIVNGFATLTFPVPFASAPAVVATFAGNVGSSTNIVAVRNITATSVDVYVYDANGVAIPNGNARAFCWIAVGPRA